VLERQLAHAQEEGCELLARLQRPQLQPAVCPTTRGAKAVVEEVTWLCRKAENGMKYVSKTERKNHGTIQSKRKNSGRSRGDSPDVGFRVKAEALPAVTAAQTTAEENFIVLLYWYISKVL